MNQMALVTDLNERVELAPAAAPTDRYAVTRSRWEAARRRFEEFVISITMDPEIKRACWRLPSSARAAGKARRLTRDRLAAWGMSDLSDTAQLLVSEFVTNALHHAYGPIDLTLSAVEGVLRCEVADNSTVVPRVNEVLDEDEDENGRGLRLVDMLAVSWGGTRTPTGKVMWFELTRDPS